MFVVTFLLAIVSAKFNLAWYKGMLGCLTCSYVSFCHASISAFACISWQRLRTGVESLLQLHDLNLAATHNATNVGTEALWQWTVMIPDEQGDTRRLCTCARLWCSRCCLNVSQLFKWFLPCQSVAHVITENYTPANPSSQRQLAALSRWFSAWSFRTAAAFSQFWHCICHRKGWASACIWVLCRYSAQQLDVI